MESFGKNRRIIFSFIPVAAIWLAALTLGGGGETAKNLSMFLGILLVLNTAVYSYFRTLDKSGFIWYLILNLFTINAFGYVAGNIAAYYSADAQTLAELFNSAHIGTVITFFVYFAVSGAVNALKKEKPFERELLGYIREAVIYFAFACIAYSGMRSLVNFTWAVIGAALLFYYAERDNNGKGAVTAFILFILSAALCAVFSVFFYGAGGEALKTVFYVLFFITLIAWFVHSLLSYRFYGLGGENAKKSGVKYILLSCIPFIMLLNYLFIDVVKALGGFGDYSYLFIYFESGGNQPFLYAIAAVILLLRIIAAICAVYFVFKDKSGEASGETDELGVSLSFEEDLKKKNIEMTEVQKAFLEALSPNSAELQKEAEPTAETKPEASEQKPSAATQNSVLKRYPEQKQPFAKPTEASVKPSYAPAAPKQAEMPPKFSVSAPSPAPKPVESPISVTKPSEPQKAPVQPISATKPSEPQKAPVQPISVTKPSEPQKAPIQAVETPVKSETAVKPIEEAADEKPRTFADVDTAEVRIENAEPTAYDVDDDAEDREMPDHSERIAEMLNDKSLTEAISELTGGANAEPDEEPLEFDEGTDFALSALYGKRIPISVPYDIRQLDALAAVKPEAEDDESKAIEEILRRINGGIK
ncbi:MAG: hypothetical protein LBQ27_02880 [Clostridiales bacterium]|jgi:hypothetical protein|nr:hypothetical protein [Clostridiales bacterium]